MSINRIHNYNFSGMVYLCSTVDSEEQRIAERLMAYGVTPTGNKTTDKARLHEIELKEAKKLNYITNKFLTVSTGEQEKIQEKKKEKRKEVNPELYPDTKKAEKALGEQIYLALKKEKRVSG